MDVRQMKDEDLISRLADCAQQERELTAQIIVCLSELASRKLFIAAGFSSLYDFCRYGLNFSRGKAYKRTKAALLVTLFPQLIDYLMSGELTESHLCIISGKLTQANFDVVVTSVSTLSKRQAMLFMARIDGAGNFYAREPEINLTIPCSEKLLEKLDRAREIMGIDRRGKSLSVLLEDMVELYLHIHDPYLKAQRSAARQEKKESKKRALEDLQSQREESESLHPGMTGEVETTREKKEEKQHPGMTGEGQAVIESEALYPGMTVESSSMIEQAKRQQHPGMKEDADHDAAFLNLAASGSEEKSSSRYIPAQVRHAVMLRDGGRCTFVAADGRRCEEVSGLEFDHVHPFACGGGHDMNNLRLRCRAHNLHWAEQVYGASFIEKKVAERRRGLSCSS
jgi:hypothetical protein